MPAVSLPWKSWLRNHWESLVTLRLLLYLIFAVIGITAHPPQTLDLLSRFGNQKSGYSQRESVGKAEGLLPFSTFASLREQEVTHDMNSPKTINYQNYIIGEDEQGTSSQDSKRKREAFENEFSLATQLIPAGPIAESIPTCAPRTAGCSKLSPIQKTRKASSYLLNGKQSTSGSEKLLTTGSAQLEPSSEQMTAANGVPKIPLTQITCIKTACQVEKNRKILRKKIRLSAYLKFRNKHVAFTRPANGWKRACSINAANWELGSAELLTVGLGRRKEEGFLDFLQSYGLKKAHSRQTPQEKLIDDRLDMISYATRATLHNIKIIHYLYDPPLFGDEVGLQNTQQEALSLLEHFWNNCGFPTVGEQPTKTNKLKEPLNQAEFTNQVKSDFLGKQPAIEISEHTMGADSTLAELKQAERIFQSEKLLAEHVLRMPRNDQVHQNSLAWIGTLHWLRIKVHGLHTQIYTQDDPEHKFKILVDDKAIAEAIYVGFPTATEVYFEKDPKLTKDW